MRLALASARAFWFGQVDCRPIALFRIAFCGLLLKDAVYHLWLARQFYSDVGALPRTVLWELNAPRFRVALMDAVASPAGAQFIFLLWIGILVLLLVGYQTRWMAVANFILIVSIHERNPFILNGADVLMRNLSFWMLFLPLGRVYAVDAVRNRFQAAAHTQNPVNLRVPVHPPTCFALPLRMAQLQVALVYLFSFLLKWDGNVWREGEAVYLALQLTDFLLPLGELLLASAPGWVFPGLTYYTLLVESLFIILVFLPFGQPRLKAVGLGLGISLHLGMLFTLSIPNFSLLMMITYLLFVEGRWLGAYRAMGQPLAMGTPADGDSRWLLLAVTRDSQVQLVDGAPQWTPSSRWETAYRMLRTPAAMWVRAYPPLSGPGRAVTRQQRPWRVGQSLLLISLMGVVLAWNLNESVFYGKLPGAVRTTVYATGLDQWWGMFAPSPPTSNGGIRVVGNFEDETQLELNTRTPPVMRPVVWRIGPWVRLRKYHEHFTGENAEPFLDAYGRYFCREYNIRGDLAEGTRLATLEIQRVWRESVPYGAPSANFQTTTLWRHWCYPQYQ